MAIAALFDEGRRKEIKEAIRRGTPIVFKRKEPALHEGRRSEDFNAAMNSVAIDISFEDPASYPGLPNRFGRIARELARMKAAGRIGSGLEEMIRKSLNITPDLHSGEGAEREGMAKAGGIVDRGGRRDEGK